MVFQIHGSDNDLGRKPTCIYIAVENTPNSLCNYLGQQQKRFNFLKYCLVSLTFQTVFTI